MTVTYSSAWLVTWDGQKAPEKKIVAILNHRLSDRRVRELVEQFYIALAVTSDDERLLYAKSFKNNPYPAKLDNFERITCGHNPWLYARRVTDLSIEGDRLVWKEPPSPDKLMHRHIRQTYRIARRAGRHR
jgi:hypothetical protein